MRLIRVRGRPTYRLCSALRHDWFGSPPSAVPWWAGKDLGDRMSLLGFSATRLALFVAAVLVAGCSVSVHAGYGKPTAEEAYRSAIAQPFNDLTAAAARTSRVCAGGSQPNPQQCYADTKAEIARVSAVERALRSTHTPAQFARANADLLRGLDVFIQGLTKRNEGLAAHSSAEYSAGSALIAKALTMQKAAFAEYPADAHIIG
jgi:hypothetical protein